MPYALRYGDPAAEDMYRQVLRRRTKCPVADRHDLQFATRLARQLTDDTYHHTAPAIIN